MHVCFLSYHCCIRVVKEGIALLKNDVGVYFLQDILSNKDTLLALPTVGFYADPDSMASKLKLLKGIDLIHCHNEPDWMGHIAKEVRPDLPLVYDAHDLDSVRHGKANPDELLSMSMADAYIFPSEGYCHEASKYYDINESGKPYAVVYSMANADAFIYDSLPPVKGIVYQGGAVSDMPHLARRDYTGVANYLADRRIPFAMYGVKERHLPAYLHAGAMCFQALPYMELLRQLSRYDWGLFGTEKPDPQRDKSMPNKIFDYLAAGIPIMALNAPEVADFVRDHEIGVAIESLDEIKQVYAQHWSLQKNVLEKRNQFTMESQVGKIKAVYDELCPDR